MVQFCCTRNLWQSHFDPKGTVVANSSPHCRRNRDWQNDNVSKTAFRSLLEFIRSRRATKISESRVNEQFFAFNTWWKLEMMCFKTDIE